MSGNNTPRAVLVTRKTDYEKLLERHSTHGQARFFLDSRGQSIEPVLLQHERFEHSLAAVRKAIPVEWRRSGVEREELDRFLFEPDDIVIALGQDGLVANIAKYLSGQTVIGLNPDMERYDGILVPHPTEAAPDLIHTAAAHRGEIERRTMVEAKLTDGQSLFALNEIFVGHRTHQSARYRIDWNGQEERQSSSGIIVASGTGCTGWARSIVRQRTTRNELELPGPCESKLLFLVREAFPSVATGTSISEGVVTEAESLEVVSEMDEDGVIFGDGIEEDRLRFHYGSIATVRQADNTLNLLRG